MAQQAVTMPDTGRANRLRNCVGNFVRGGPNRMLCFGLLFASFCTGCQFWQSSGTADAPTGGTQAGKTSPQVEQPRDVSQIGEGSEYLPWQRHLADSLAGDGTQPPELVRPPQVPQVPPLPPLPDLPDVDEHGRLKIPDLPPLPQSPSAPDVPGLLGQLPDAGLNRPSPGSVPGREQRTSPSQQEDMPQDVRPPNDG